MAQEVSKSTDIQFWSENRSVQENVDELLNLDTKFAPWNTERHEPGDVAVMIRVMTNYGFRVYVTRQEFEHGRRRTALTGVLNVLLPFVVFFTSGDLASTRHALASA